MKRRGGPTAPTADELEKYRRPWLSVTHHSIEVAGELVGHAISLGTRYELYTIHPRLKTIDSLRFASLAGLRAAVTDGLKPRKSRDAAMAPNATTVRGGDTDLMNDQTFHGDPRTVKGG